MIDYVFQKGGTLNLYFILCTTPGYFTVNCISFLCFIRNKKILIQKVIIDVQVKYKRNKK